MSDLKTQVAALVKAKQYPAAIILLENSNHPGQAVTIERLRARMADESQSQDDKLKALIAAGDYGQARELLRSIDHPKKEAMLAELDRRIQGVAAPVALPVKAKQKPRYTWRGVFILVMFTLSLICGIQTIASFTANQEAIKQVTIQFKMARVCQDVFEQKYFDDRYTVAQYVDGCAIAADHSIEEYPKEINYCYDNHNETDALFMRCLADNDVKISDIWLITAPKE